ncbi:MAG: endo-1,4-beta-xylanase [Oscillospiraceae bacterium]|nr:endo-1,4-beta-xylanase [Oscillospiraceae bacterium]
MNKKKICAVITSAVLSVGMISAAPVGSILKANALLVSDSFEINYDGWTNCGDQTLVEAVNDVSFNSTRSMHVSRRTGREDGASSEKSFYIDAGKSYRFSAQVFQKQAECETFMLSMQYLPSDSDTYVTKTFASKKADRGEWTQLSGKFKAPEGASQLVLKITTDSTNDFYFDDFKITGNRSGPAAAGAADVGLKDIYANYFRIGSVPDGNAVKQSPFTAMILKEYNSITCKYELKPDATMDKAASSGTNVAVSLSHAASLLNFCAQNNIGVRGNTLVWHTQTPEWFFKENFDFSGSWVSEEVMDARMESYIRNMFTEIRKQYPTLDLYAYDVCNECVSEDSERIMNNGGAREPGFGSGKSPWVRIYGSNKFVEKAFAYAKKYAPDTCSLFYNDYNEYWDVKRDCIAAMCESLYKKGLLDGIGMQSHTDAQIEGFTGVSNYTAAIKKFAAIGCQVQITELEVSTERGQYASTQADKYKAVFKAAIDINKTSAKGRVTAVCVMGPNDPNMWIDSYNDPLLFDKYNKPKDAYYAVAGLIPEYEWKIKDPPATGTHNPDEPDENGYYFHDDFESSEGFWLPKGSAELSITNNKAYAGSYSLYASSRTDTWNGVMRPLSPLVFKPGSKYSFSADVAYDYGNPSETFIMTLQYTDESGETQYEKMDTKSAVKGEFVQLSAPDFLIPEGASDAAIVIETTETLVDFFVDEAIGAVSGTEISGPDQTKIIRGDINCDGRINIIDFILIKAGLLDKFNSTAAQTAADVDRNGSVTSADILMLAQYLLGLRTGSFPQPVT